MFGTETSSYETISLSEAMRMGLGTQSNSPGNILHVHQSDATANSYVHITHADGGSGTTDGLSVGIEDGGVNAVIRNRENGYLRMYTNNTERLRIDSSGNICVGRTANRLVFLSIGRSNTGGLAVEDVATEEMTGIRLAMVLMTIT